MQKHVNKIQGNKDDQHKPMISLIPPLGELEVAKVLTFGAHKYGVDNWRLIKNSEQRYLDAALRHINKHKSDAKIDPETGYYHLAHAICSLQFMLEKELECGPPTNLLD